MLASKTILKILVNTLFGLSLIIIWLQFVDTVKIFSIIKTIRWEFLVPVFICQFLSPAIRAWRLKIFLSPIKKIGLVDLIFLNGVTQLLNFFIPIRAGEIAKGVYLHSNFNLNLSESIVWVFLDRFVDFLIVLALASGLFFIIPTTLSIKFITVIIIILSFTIVLTYLIVYKSYFAKKTANFLRYLLIFRILKIYFDRLFNFCIQSFKIFKKNEKNFWLLILLTILGYGADGAIWYFLFLGLGSPQHFLKMYLGQLLSALTYLIPAAPGYVGSAEASGLAILTGVFGIEANLASAQTILFHLTTAIFILLFGIISLYLLKMDLSLILKKALRKS